MQPDGDLLSYRHLDGDWALFYKIARHFVHKVKKEDRADFLHDLLLEMAKVKAKYKAKGKPLTEAGLMRVASYEVLDYWERNKLLARGIVVDCGGCGREQRRKCRDEDLYPGCPRAKRFISLNERIGRDGDETELWEVLADDRALDLEAWVDAKLFLLSSPKSLVRIVYKRYIGLPLSNRENGLLSYYRRKSAAGGSWRALQKERPRCRQQEKLRISPEEVERIRAYFSEGKGIKQIARDLHHARRTVRKAISSTPGWPPGAEESGQKGGDTDAGSSAKAQGSAGVPGAGCPQEIHAPGANQRPPEGRLGSGQRPGDSRCPGVPRG